MKPSIEAAEVAEVFRGALRGEIAVKLAGERSWEDVWCGDVEFIFGDWRITIFNDVMELDYVDHAVAPDGRTVEYEDWFNDENQGADPVDLLTLDEQRALEKLLDGVRTEAA